MVKVSGMASAGQCPSGFSLNPLSSGDSQLSVVWVGISMIFPGLVYILFGKKKSESTELVLFKDSNCFWVWFNISFLYIGDRSSFGMMYQASRKQD